MMVELELLVHVLPVPDRGEQCGAWFHKEKQRAVRSCDAERECQRLSTELFRVQARIMPIQPEDFFLLSVEALDVGRELSKLLGELVGIDDPHTRRRTRPAFQSRSARWSEARSRPAFR